MRRAILYSLIMGGLCAFPLIVLAQEETQTKYQLPAITVSSISLDKSTDQNTVSGSFIVQNIERKAISDLRYELSVIGRSVTTARTNSLTSDSSPIFFRTITKDVIDVLPNSYKEIKLHQTIPDLPLGEYRVRIRLINSQGTRLGWKEISQKLGTATGFFSDFKAGAIVQDNNSLTKAGKTNVTPEANFSIEGIASLSRRTGKLTAIPHLTIYSFDVTGEKMSEKKYDPIDIVSGEKTIINIPVQAENKPGAYLGVLSLLDESGNRVSSLAEYRWSVIGPSAHVVSAQFDQIAFKKGTEAQVSAGVVGSADLETQVNATVVTELLDGNSVIDEKEALVSLDKGVSHIPSSFLLTKNLRDPGIRVTVKDEEKNVLDKYVLGTEFTVEELSAVSGGAPVPITDNPLTYLGFFFLGVVVFFMILEIKRNKITVPMKKMTVILLATSISMFWASGDIISAPQKPSVLLYLEQPQANKVYDPTSLPLQFDARIAATNEVVSSADVAVRYGEGSELLSGSYATPSCVKGSACVKPTNGFNALLEIPNATELTDTTVSFESNWGDVHGSDKVSFPIKLSRPPKGAIEGLSCTSVSGFAFDPDSDSPTELALYIDQPGPTKLGDSLFSAERLPQNGGLIGTIKADSYHPEHEGDGFSFGLNPTNASKLYDGQEHTLYVYGVDSQGVSASCLPNATPPVGEPNVCGTRKITCSNESPVAELSVSSESTCRGIATTFVGKGIDPEGGKLRYRLHVTGMPTGAHRPEDSVTENVPSGEEVTTTLTFPDPGEYTVQLEVSDEGRDTKRTTIEKAIIVQDYGSLQGQLFVDLNENKEQEHGELFLADDEANLACAEDLPISGAYVQYSGTASGTAKPDQCIDFRPYFVAEKLCPGAYNVSANFPKDWTATTKRTKAVTVVSGETAEVVFGGKPPKEE